ncbi:unnamed protein product [Colias eurytheme]|nr:unnamed protein product [Colias eurytheme]
MNHTSIVPMRLTILGLTAKGIKKPISKGNRLVIVHAGGEAGFVPNALLTFKAGTKSGDYHNNMNSENYERWLRTKLIPNLPPNSVVVVDNASYHNKQLDAAPTSNTKKADMQTWLQQKEIKFDESMLKPELYNLIKKYKEQFKKFNIDAILNETGHAVLRLPPYHPDLNQIEMAWSQIKGYVASKNVSWNLARITDLVNDKVNLMGATEWAKLCTKGMMILSQMTMRAQVTEATMMKWPPLAPTSRPHLDFTSPMTI